MPPIPRKQSAGLKSTKEATSALAPMSGRQRTADVDEDDPDIGLIWEGDAQLEAYDEQNEVRPKERRPVATNATRRAKQYKNENVTFPYYSKDPDEWCVKRRTLRVSRFHPNVSPKKKCCVTPFQAPVVTYLWLLEDYLDITLEETNKHGCQRFENAEVKRRWFDVTKAELLMYYGLATSMGACIKSNMDLYFSEKGINSTPQYSKYMTRHRFKQIRAHLHYEDNETALLEGWGDRSHTDYDPIHKIRRVMDAAYDRFILARAPGRNLSLDEQVEHIISVAKTI